MSGAPQEPEVPSPPQDKDEPEPLTPAGSALWSVVFAWIFPGAGHLYLGRRPRAAVFAATILFLFLAGLSLGGRLYRVEPREPFSLLGTFTSMGLGLPYFVVRFFAQDDRLPAIGQLGDIFSPTFEIGTTFVLTAGIMNLLLMLDAFDIASGKKR